MAGRLAVTATFLLTDTSSGHAVGELPLTPGGPIPRRLNDIGTWTATLPADHPMAADNILNTAGFSKNSDRELTVLRYGVPVWNGPVVGVQGDDDAQTVTLTMAEASWWMKKRVLEIDKNYDGSSLSNDVYDIVRDLGHYMLNKEDNGLTSGGSSINAALPRFTVAPTSGSSGVTKNVSELGTDRRTWADIIGDIVSDPSFGCDWRMDISGTRHAVQRTLRFGVPSLGQNIDIEIRKRVVAGFSKTLDRERAGNRAHVVGDLYTDTEQNTVAVTNGDTLMDVVAARSDLQDTGAVTQLAKDLRRRAQPWVSTYTAAYTPNDTSGLPFGFCQPGDAAYISYRTGTHHFLRTGPGYARVIGTDWTPGVNGSPEMVELQFDIPLDEIGA